MSESRRTLLSIATCLAVTLILVGLWGVADGLQTDRWIETGLAAALAVVAGWAARHLEIQAMPEFFEEDTMSNRPCTDL